MIDFKNKISIDTKENYLILTDLHLEELDFFKEKELIEKLEAYPELTLIILGDYCYKNKEKAEFLHKELTDEIYKHNPIFVNGDKDVNIGVDAVKYGDFLLFHGHQLEPLYQYNKLFKFLSFFKSKKYKGINKEHLHSLYKKIVYEHYIIGHFRQDKHVCGSRILEPRKLYLLKKSVVTQVKNDFS